MKTWRKELSLLLVGMMIMSGLVAFSAPVIADYNMNTDVALAYDNNWQEPDVEPANDVKLIYNYDVTGGNPYLLGNTNDEIQLGIVNRDITVPIYEVEVTLTSPDSALLNIVGYDHTGVAWGTTNVDDDFGTTINVDGTLNDIAASGTRNARFRFDIAPGVALGLHQISIKIDYEKPDATTLTITQTAFIYISSIFDDTTTQDIHEGLLNGGALDNEAWLWETAVSGEDQYFEAGDQFVEANLYLRNYATAITNLVGTLTLPTTTPANQITAVQGKTVASNAGIAAVTTDADALRWRLNIASNTKPDVYDGSVAITYTRNGQDINEGSHPIGFPIDFNFADADCGPIIGGVHQKYSEEQIRATQVVITDFGDGGETRDVTNIYPLPYAEIEQSSGSDRLITFNVTVENNGNIDLANVVFGFSPTTAWEYFRNPVFYWEHDATIVGNPLYDSAIFTVPDFPVGGTQTFTIKAIVDKEIPIGEHRLPIIYNGFYYNGAELGGSSGFDQTFANLEIYFSIMVTDSVIQCHVSGIDTAVTDEAGDKGQIIAEIITVTLVNDEGYAFINVMVQADFTGTPWYMPVIGLRNPLVWADNANEAMPYTDDWTDSDDAEVDFTVDTDPSLVPDRYPFVLHITATIKETLEVVTATLDYRQGAVIDFGGYGPRLQISAFTAEDIVPGKMFNMDLVIENVGDDTLRDVYVEIACDTTAEYGWGDVIGFQDQFDWTAVYENWMDVEGPIEIPDDMFYTMESLDVDNVREIVEINLYMDGVYSMPGARISLIRIIDLAPNARFNVTYEMFADKDMVNGKPYAIDVAVTGTNSIGTTTTDTLVISVMSSQPGKSYNPVELNWFDAGLKALALFLFFIIVLAILLFVYNMFKGEPYDDEDDFDFEDDEPFEPAPMEPAPAPEAPQQELIEP
ncbi:MAG: hypothetical protein KKH41_09440 [Candidatus Thermoplasmatota archaeon]|nr:hypothetical protein [Euryarchaeota archaeon]MBU4031289.1 hypothetical protein [Candidatus Thermoplasmatota archaeon]MBU4071222.1 hypothetical protein [Candidatus Thermoplasmatota archaeon]MBU4145071.1 hypothetical protein [Candidatus Thermoplasmatota archaeon]MBU4592789.1 hypothetical protein [Candidatus Thermoplasmatota archaeon]